MYLVRLMCGITPWLKSLDLTKKTGRQHAKYEVTLRCVIGGSVLVYSRKIIVIRWAVVKSHPQEDVLLQGILLLEALGKEWPPFYLSLLLAQWQVYQINLILRNFLLLYQYFAPPALVHH